MYRTQSGRITSYVYLSERISLSKRDTSTPISAAAIRRSVHRSFNRNNVFTPFNVINNSRMVRRRGRKAGKGKKTSRRTSRRLTPAARRLNAAQATRTSGLGKLIGTGIRQLVGMLPGGAVLQPLADFSLRALGMSNNTVISSGQLRADVHFCCMYGKLALTLASIAQGSPLVTTAGVTNHRSQIRSPFREARILSLTVSVRPTSPISNRAGEWTLCLVPFYDDGMRRAWSNQHALTSREMQLQEFSATGSYAAPLAITYRPRVVDGECFQFHELSTVVVGVAVRYDRMNRTSYGEFSADDFSFDMIVNGRLQYRGAPSYDQGIDDALIYSADVVDELKSTGAFVNAYSADKGVGRTYCLARKDMTCTTAADGSHCVVTGTVQSLDNLRLSQMELNEV